MCRGHVVLPLCFAGALACEKPAPIARRDVGSDSASTAAGPGGGTVSGDWPGGLGSALLVPSDTAGLVIVLFPVGTETAAFSTARFSLLGPSGDTVLTRAALNGSDSLRCADAPVTRFRTEPPPVWSVGFAGSRAAPVRTDSMDALSTADSMSYATEMARLASTVAATHPSRLAGLAFSLVSMRRMRIGATEIVAAQLARRLYQEANPTEERTLVLAERDRAAGAPFTLAHGERSEGSEETAAHFDLLSALRLSDATYLILSSDRPSGTVFELVERKDTGAWRVVWTRAITC